MVRRRLALVLAVLFSTLPFAGRAQEEKKPTGPTFTPYGFLLLNAFFNSRAFNTNDYPDFVLPARTAINDSLFAMEARASRIGVRIGLGEALGAQVGGVLEADFLATFTPNTQSIEGYRPMMRLRLAYGTATWGTPDARITLLAGQDYALVNPLFASTLAWGITPLFQNAGNAYIRAPQVQVKGEFGKDVGLTIAIAALQPFDQTPAAAAGSNPGLAQQSGNFSPGERARIPQLEARVAGRYKAGDIGGELGVGGSYHKERYALNANLNTNKDLDAWLTGLDLVVRVPFIELRGETFFATNQDTYFLHLGQGGVNLAGTPTNITDVTSRRTKGGWAQVIISPIPMFQVTAGYGVELPFVEDIRPANAGNRVRNSQATLGLIFIASRNWRAAVEWANTITSTQRVQGTGTAARQVGVIANEGYETVVSTQYTF
jgi:hypothetical protein